MTTKIHYPFPKVVLFDWDNTLMDTTPALYKAFNVLRQSFDMPAYTMQEYRARTGLSLRETFPQMFGDDWERAKQIYLSAYQECHLEMLTPFKDAERSVACAFEKTGAVGIVSNKTQSILDAEVDHLGWRKMLCAVVGAGGAPKDKPAPDPVYKALENTTVKIENGKLSDPVWFVGDGDADMLCAVNSGCLRVRFSETDKDGPDVLTVKNCTEFLSVLYSYDKKD